MQRLVWIFVLVSGVLFLQVGYARSGELEISGDVKFPPFIKTNDRIPITINVAGGPADGDEVVVVFDFTVSRSKGPGAPNKTQHWKGRIVSGSVVVHVWFREPGERTAGTCRIRFKTSGTVHETKAAPVNSFEVSRR